MAIAWKTRRFTVAEYHRMGEVRILGEADRVELLDGEIVEMTPIGPARASTVDRLTQLLVRLVGPRAIVRVQSPVELPAFESEPQPDLALLRPRADFYRSAHPGAGDVLLLVEVLDASAARDRRLKLPLYARAGVEEVWLVELAAEQVEICRAPAPDGYRDRRVMRRGEALTVAALPALAVRVDDVLG